MPSRIVFAPSAPTWTSDTTASIYSLVETARLNGVDPEAWLIDTIRRIADHPARRVAELLPWNYRPA